MSPRPRSNDKAVPISIALPQSLLDRLNRSLDWRKSRSRWVKNAIVAKLDAHNDESQVIAELSNKRLIVLLFNRNVINWFEYENLISKLELPDSGNN
jgi:metal-responsive CopG/Arc/MetJ family transcriptional regulator